jgi:glycogen debranching enzyme
MQHKSPRNTHSIASAVVIKDEDIFFLTDQDGDVALKGPHGFGLFHHDCRFLNGYELRIAGTRPCHLTSTAGQGFQSVFELANEELHVDNEYIPQNQLGVKWEHLIDSRKHALYDLLTLENNGADQINLPITLTFQAHFEDIFVVRGMPQQERGTLHDPTYDNGVLSFVYDGADNIRRALRVQFWPAPQHAEGGTVTFQCTLPSKEQQQIHIALTVAEARAAQEARSQTPAQPNIAHVQHALHQSFEEWMHKHTAVQSSNVTLNHLLDRSLRDLRMLRSYLKQREFFAAGTPWFVALFGRDSLISAMQTLAYEPELAAQTIRLLASYQGQHKDPDRAEQPGKILHELRVGEMAHLHEIPQTPYYGTVDATPLFVILVAQHAAWTGDLALFNDVREHVDRALDWMDKYGGLADDGYLRYGGGGAREGGLGNQGWKDSGDAIVNADGSLATPPIALVEVQGYVYMAKTSIADLYERAGAHDRAGQLRQEAAALRERFNRDFWLPDKHYYALALQKDNRPAAVIASNPGQALWTGIVDAGKAQHVAEHLMADDMFSGWGVRTLSSDERRYNPVGYHLGTVWPHDNSIIAAGLRRYGKDDAARKIFEGIGAAATCFRHDRLPEVFAGFARATYDKPVHYPVACHPQAWAAGSIPFLLTTMLGLTPDAFAQQLRIVRPMLPDGVQQLDMQRLRVGTAQVELRFERSTNGVAVQTLHVDGDLKVVTEA